MRIPRTAIGLFVLAALLAWLSVQIVETSTSGWIACLIAAIGTWSLASVILAASHHNQRLERLGREADAQHRLPGLKEEQS